MIESLAEFDRFLNALNPAADEFVLQIDELVEQLPESIAAEVYPAVFAFFEKHPDADCGAPGTLVHHVERYYPNYVDTLLQSARNKPSYNSALMLNRILNSDIPDLQRAEMLDILNSIAASDAVSSIVRDLAMRFIQYQAQRRI
jgi:hypothetical protein